MNAFEEEILAELAALPPAAPERFKSEEVEIFLRKEFSDRWEGVENDDHRLRIVYFVSHHNSPAVRVKCADLVLDERFGPALRFTQMGRLDIAETKLPEMEFCEEALTPEAAVDAEYLLDDLGGNRTKNNAVLTRREGIRGHLYQIDIHPNAYSPYKCWHCPEHGLTPVGGVAWEFMRLLCQNCLEDFIKSWKALPSGPWSQSLPLWDADWKLDKARKRLRDWNKQEQERAISARVELRAEAKHLRWQAKQVEANRLSRLSRLSRLRRRKLFPNAFTLTSQLGAVALLAQKERQAHESSNQG